jgi:hypothetical protein
MSPTNDLEEELLRRFHALKSPPTTAPTAGPSFKNISDEQARKAKADDEELERIADGRPPMADVGAKQRGGLEDDMARRIARLKGVEYELEDEDDQEVRLQVCDA